jgi:hypothetical protein
MLNFGFMIYFLDVFLGMRFWFYDESFNINLRYDWVKFFNVNIFM